MPVFHDSSDPSTKRHLSDHRTARTRSPQEIHEIVIAGVEKADTTLADAASRRQVLAALTKHADGQLLRVRPS
jgi:hypothetical protein